MKKTALLALLLCLCLCLGMMAVACNDTPDTPDTGDQGGDEPSGDDNTDQGPDGDKNDTIETPDDTFTYTVTVKGVDGNPIEGVEVQICIDGSCLMPNATGADGTVQFSNVKVSEGSVAELQINSCPEGYVCPAEKLPIEAGVTEITVTLEKAN